MSDELRKFLQEWLAWADAGGVMDDEHVNLFSNYSGLCDNAWRYSFIKGIKAGSLEYEVKAALYTTRFSGDYPFGGRKLFYQESDNGTTHLNEARLNWVRRQLCQKT